MESFREHEKEFKKKQFSKKALQDLNNNAGREHGSQSDDSDNEDGDYDEEGEDEDSYGNEGEQSDSEAEKKNNILKAQDKEFFTQVVDFMKIHLGKIEGELEILRNKKGNKK